MKTISVKIFSSILLTVLLSVWLSPLDAAASHNTCRIKAGTDDVQVRVFDRDPDGNPIRDAFTYGEIWRGVLKKGESRIVESSHGSIDYSYRSLSDSRTYGGNLASCAHGETIRVP